MNILSGLYPVTSGDGKIHGKSVVSELAAAQRHMGTFLFFFLPFLIIVYLLFVFRSISFESPMLTSYMYIYFYHVLKNNNGSQ